MQVTMKELLEAGVHFGHQTRRWNPKMKPYIFGKRNGIYIIDLQKSLALFNQAVDYVRDMGRAGQRILFVGTKRQARDVIAEEAERCGQFHMTHRWLGGTLTNFVTIRASVERLKDIEQRLAQEDSPMLKKERLRLDREREKMHKNLHGIRGMDRLPDAMFVVDPKREYIAVAEANKLDIPVIGIVDTNCDPELIDFVIPGNDDAIRTIRLFASRIADAYLEGADTLAKELTAASEPEAESAEAEAAAESGAGSDDADAGEPQAKAAAADSGSEAEADGLADAAADKDEDDVEEVDEAASVN